MYRLYVKRIIDIILCLIALPLFLLIFIPISILIKLEDRGPIFYCGDRVGKNGKIFKMYKFRSMNVNAPDLRNEDGSTYNSKDDSRVTRIGKVLRETSIDEIPQILNVLKGDMSIIGPRPNLASVLDMFKDDEQDKMLIRPGITGYTQAYFRNSIIEREKILKDVWYASNVSFKIDIKIFFKTIVTVLKREGIYTNDTSHEIYKDRNKMRV